MKTPLARIRMLNRRKERGAALVEAALVIPVMVVFIGLIMFTHNSYDQKMDKQLGTRSGSLYYASHACKGDVPPDVVPTLDEADPGIPLGPQNKNAGKVGGSNSPAAQAGVRRKHNLVKAHPQESSVGRNGKTPTAVQNGQTVLLDRKISAESEVACNEEVFSSKWTAVFQEIGSLYKSRGGLKD